MTSAFPQSSPYSFKSNLPATDSNLLDSCLLGLTTAASACAVGTIGMNAANFAALANPQSPVLLSLLVQMGGNDSAGSLVGQVLTRLLGTCLHA